MSAIQLKEVADTAIATPPAGKVAVFVDVATGEPSYKDEAGTVASLKGGPGPEGPAGPGVPVGGTIGQVLTKTSATDFAADWATPADGFANPMTTGGDLIVGGASGAAQRLGAGADGQSLTMVSGAPTWTAPEGAGDVIGPAESADNTLPRFNGTGGKTLQASGVVVDDADAISGYKGAVNRQTGTSYALVAADSGKIVELANASAITLTLPNSLPAGFCCTIVQDAAGQVTLATASGATIKNRQTHTKLAGNGAFGTLYVSSNAGTAAAYRFGGDTAA